MEKADVTWRLFGMYVLVIFFTLLCSGAFAQIQVAQFNAGWNSANAVGWTQDLEDCKTISYVDISKQSDLAKKHKIAVIPTIIIFKDDVEVARFQADLSFKMIATKEEVQEEINNQLMSDF
tara:strand:+ start:335 stop:697 length:363 start_codon:yes stop_codon:yes gene_type:complete